MLELKNLYKTFNAGTVNEKRAIDGLDLTLEESTPEKEALQEEAQKAYEEQQQQQLQQEQQQGSGGFSFGF